MVKNTRVTEKMDSNKTLVHESKKIQKKHKKKNATTNGVLSTKDEIITDGIASPVKMNGSTAGVEIKAKKNKNKKKGVQNVAVVEEKAVVEETKSSKKTKKDKKKDAELDVEDKELGRRTVPVVDSTFESLRPHVSEATMTAIEGFGFTEMTKVQQETIPLLLASRDVSAIAKTGSGKTLAFVIPAVERVKDHLHGTTCIILSPTRELAQQTYNVVGIVAANHRNLTHGIVMGGTKIEKEKAILAEGVNILVATPGRLLDHMRNTKGFRLNKLRVLVLDEADRILDAGFEKDIKSLMQRLPVRRQTMQFSATATNRLNNITHNCLAVDYKTVNLISDTNTAVTSELLTQTYLVVPTFQRLMVLHKIIMENKDKKVMIFLNTCDGVNLYKAIFNKLGIEVHGIHGRQGQLIRTNIFKEFSEAASGVLLCTDIAARGWDIPAVHLIVQYDPPSDVNEYIHRVGRAARRPGEVGQAVLMLREEERSLVNILANKRLELTEYKGLDMYSLQYDVQDKVNELVSTETGLKDLAVRAYRNFLTSYAVLNPKNIYNRKTIEPTELAKCFGLKYAPAFDYSREPLKTTEKDSFGKPKPKTRKEKAGKENKKTNPVSKMKGKKNKKDGNASAESEENAELTRNEKKKKAKERRQFYKDLRATKKLEKAALKAENQENKSDSSSEKTAVATPKKALAEGKNKKQSKSEAAVLKTGGKSNKRKQQDVEKTEAEAAPKKAKTETSVEAKQSKQGSPKKKNKNFNLKKGKKSGVKQLNVVKE